MAVDRTLLQRAEQASYPVTWVRFYRWSLPTVSLGRNQSRRAVNVRACLGRSIPIVVRPTGGRAVFHCDELTYAVVSNDPALFPSTSISVVSKSLARVLREGLLRLGIETDLCAGTAPGMTPLGSSPFRGRREVRPCFVSSARYELLHQGRKIVGSAQRRLRLSFLQHGSIPLTVDFDLMAEVLGARSQELAASMTCVSAVAHSHVSFDSLAAALRAGFEEFLSGTR